MNWYEDGIKKHRRCQFTDLTSDIDILHPQFAFSILKLFINAHKEGLEVCVFETHRSQERQLEAIKIVEQEHQPDTKMQKQPEVKTKELLSLIIRWLNKWTNKKQ